MADTSRLTSFNPGSGCGCKIAPNVLQEVLGASGFLPQETWPGLLVGHDANDDAAVMDLGDGRSLVHTTDFFTPIVDDPFTFGRIAAANALSDVYAMGGTPQMALALLCWPLQTLPATMAGEVIAGARSICREAGIPLAGGHSIDVPQPIFGLSVTGIVPTNRIVRNGGAQPGDLLYLTKPLGLGIVATAMKKGMATEEDRLWAEQTMTELNQVGAALGALPGVHAMTDVTGFGLVGHLHEMMSASDCSAHMPFSQVPTYRTDRLADLYAAGCMPQGTTKNYVTYYSDCSPVRGEQLFVLFDPQTSGGLLIAVHPDAKDAVEAEMIAHDAAIYPIGQVTASQDHRIVIVS